MTRRYVYIAFFLFGLCAAGAAQDVEPRYDNTVHLVSEPSAAEVWLGDSLLGSTPIVIAKDIAGAVDVYYPGRFDWDAEVQRLPRQPVAGNKGVTLLRFSLRSTVRSMPSGAAVFIGDSLFGYTPLRLDSAFARSPFRLEKPGYHSLRIADPTEHPAGGVHVLPINGDLIISGDVIVRNSDLELPPARILLPAGVSIVAGVLAVHFKQLADERYAGYRLTGNEALLSETEKYDIYAGISLVIMQLGIGYLLYLVITDG